MVVRVDEKVVLLVNEVLDENDVFVALEEDEVLVDVKVRVSVDVEVLLVLLLVVESAVGTLLRNAGSGLPAMMSRQERERERGRYTS